MRMPSWRSRDTMHQYPVFLDGRVIYMCVLGFLYGHRSYIDLYLIDMLWLL